MNGSRRRDLSPKLGVGSQIEKVNMRVVAVVVLVTLVLTSPPATCQESVNHGAWMMARILDPITDENTSRMFTDSEGVIERVSLSGADPMVILSNTGLSGVLLSVKCNGSDDLDIMLNAISPPETWGDVKEVVWRFDRTEVSRARWGTSEDGRTLFVPSDSRAAFILNAKGSSTVVVRFVVAGLTKTYEFSLNGFTRAFGGMGC